MNAARNTGARSAGFTLMELVIVMGLLCGFLLMLVQFLDSGVPAREMVHRVTLDFPSFFFAAMTTSV